MKKFLLSVCLVMCSIIVIIYILGIKPFSNIDEQAEKDYVNHKEVLMQFVIENVNDNMFMTKDMYDKTSVCTCKIFEDLQYQFIRVSHGNIFFCKEYDGMTGIGLLYSETSFIPNPKQKVLKILDEEWVIIAEHVL